MKRAGFQGNLGAMISPAGMGPSVRIPPEPVSHVAFYLGFEKPRSGCLVQTCVNYCPMSTSLEVNEVVGI